MTCRELVDFVMRYLEGELPPDTVAAFEEHLAGCTMCRAFLDQYRLTIEAGREAFCESRDDALSGLPEDLVSAILAATPHRQS